MLIFIILMFNFSSFHYTHLYFLYAYNIGLHVIDDGLIWWNEIMSILI